MLPVFINIVATIACLLTVLVANIAKGEQLPVVLVHGIMADEHDMGVLEGYIKEAIPGVYVHSVTIGKGKRTSFWNLYRQGQWLNEEIKSDPKLVNGFNMICHSQGGLTGRYYLERFNTPRVVNYISLATPQRGVFGLPGTYDSRWKLLNYFENLARFFLYRRFIQNHFSVAQMWNDTLHVNQYLKCNNFLPYLNNEVDHDLSSTYKANICSLEHMVLIGSIGDEIVEPLESAHFGYYKNGSKSVYEKYFEWEAYKSDALGLKFLDDNKKLHLFFSNASHEDVPEDKDCFTRFVLPFLNNEKRPRVPEDMLKLDPYEVELFV